MITLGLDPHPGSHTVVALDNNGAALGHVAVPNTPEGLKQLHEFGSRFSPRRWAVEGAGNHFIAALLRNRPGLDTGVARTHPHVDGPARDRCSGDRV